MQLWTRKKYRTKSQDVGASYHLKIEGKIDIGMLSKDDSFCFFFSVSIFYLLHHHEPVTVVNAVVVYYQ